MVTRRAVYFPAGRAKPSYSLVGNQLSAGRLYGIPVLRAEADPEGFWGERRLRRAGRGLGRGGYVFPPGLSSDFYVVPTQLSPFPQGGQQGQILPVLPGQWPALDCAR